MRTYEHLCASKLENLDKRGKIPRKTQYQKKRKSEELYK